MILYLLCRYVIKQAFSAKIIENGQEWINRLEQRNMMSHTYNPKTFEKAINAISKHYIALLEKLYYFFKEKDQK